MHDIIITFDNYGVSGHPNHIATYEGVKNALSHINGLNNNIVGLQLDSVNTVRKFMGIFDLLLAYLTAENLILNLHISNIFIIWSAMYSHKSQFVWYRIFFILLSRYTYMNTFTVIH
jgi:N-acetylglucosaminylphosphatidylinositol deacetylase